MRRPLKFLSVCVLGGVFVWANQIIMQASATKTLKDKTVLRAVGNV